MDKMTLSPFLTAPFRIETETNGLVILRAVEGILGGLRLLVDILAFALPLPFLPGLSGLLLSQDHGCGRLAA